MAIKMKKKTPPGTLLLGLQENDSRVAFPPFTLRPRYRMPSTRCRVLAGCSEAGCSEVRSTTDFCADIILQNLARVLYKLCDHLSSFSSI